MSIEFHQFFLVNNKKNLKKKKRSVEIALPSCDNQHRDAKMLVCVRLCVCVCQHYINLRRKETSPCVNSLKSVTSSHWPDTGLQWSWRWKWDLTVECSAPLTSPLTHFSPLLPQFASLSHTCRSSVFIITCIWNYKLFIFICSGLVTMLRNVCVCNQGLFICHRPCEPCRIPAATGVCWAVV